MARPTSLLARVAWWTGHLAPLLAVVAAALGLGGVFWERLSHPAVLGIVAALSGVVWWADYALRNHLVGEQERLERTPPALEFVDAKLLGENLLVAIKSTNLVPFACHCVCITPARNMQGNNIVGGILTQDIEVFPGALTDNILVFEYPIQMDKIVENYLELRFRYYSVYSAKLGNPKELGQRELVVAWHTNGGALTRTDPRPRPAQPAQA
jgi:hypothetical protein